MVKGLQSIRKLLLFVLYLFVQGKQGVLERSRTVLQSRSIGENLETGQILEVLIILWNVGHFVFVEFAVHFDLTCEI